MTTQINLRIEEKVLTEIDKSVKTDVFLKNRSDFIKRAIEEKLKRTEDPESKKNYEFL